MSNFGEYWKHSSDEIVENFLMKSNWMWLLNKKKNKEEEVNNQIVNLNSISSRVDTNEEKEMGKKVAHLDNIRNRVNEDGYYSSANTTSNNVRIPAETDIPVLTVEKLEIAVKTLVDLGYPASFVLLLDECWEAIDSMKEMMMAGTGNDTCNMDILAWLIDPNKGSGFSPHRDRQPDDINSSFRLDGSPKYATCWLALTPSHCDNSCLYVIPKYLDPGYSVDDGTAVDKTPSSSSRAPPCSTSSSSSSSSSTTSFVLPSTASIPPPSLSSSSAKNTDMRKSSRINRNNSYEYDPLRTALKDKESYQHIRALPLDAGGVVIFTHRILHWGSKGRPSYKGEPRISISVAFSDPTFEAPYLLQEGCSPAFSLRLALACAQMIIYYQRFNFSQKELLFFKKCFDTQAVSFDKSYRSKVLFEYASAVLEIEMQQKKEGEVASFTDQEGDKQGVKGVGEREADDSDDDEGERLQDHDDYNDEDQFDEDLDDGDEIQGEDDDDSDDEDDGGFLLCNEDEKDDPLEHALEAMLEMEVCI
jgi:hypothetical protein